MKLRPLGLGTACAILAVFVVVVFPMCGSVAYLRSGVDGIRTAGAAAAICWLTATSALVLTGWVRNSTHAVAGILVASGLRFGIPLAAGLALQSQGGGLANAGIFGWIVVFFLLTLAAETTLSVSLDRNQNHGDGKGIVTNG